MKFTLSFTLMLSLLSVLTVAACGGADNLAPDGPQAIARPPVNTASFTELALQAPCADVSNRFYVINQKFVFRDAAGHCADGAWARTLYGATPQDVVCSERDSIAGPVSSCDPAFRALFGQIDRNRDKADLGLGSAYKVEPLILGSSVSFRQIDASQVSGITIAQNLVIKDVSEWGRVWALHTANVQPAPSLPTVDFSRKMVLAMFNGQKPNGCHVFGSLNLSLNGAPAGTASGSTLRVVHSVPLPDPAANCTQSMVTPAALIEVDRIDGSVRFVADSFSY